MSYLYNSPINNSYNNFRPGKTETFTAKKSARESICAPSYIPKYSIENELKKQDEFRKNTEIQQRKRYTKKEPVFPKIVAVTTALASSVLLFSSKKILCGEIK